MSVLQQLKKSQLRDLDQGGRLWHLYREAATVKAGGLYFFSKAIWPLMPEHRNLISRRCHLPLCMACEDDSLIRLLIEWPRKHGKSTIATVCRPVQRLARMAVEGEDPCTRFAIYCSSKENAKRHWRDIRNGIDGNELFRFLFPELVPPVGDREWIWNTEEGVVPRTYNPKEPTFDTLGGGKSTSRHYDDITVDDMIDEQNFDSPTAVEMAIEYYRLTRNLLEDEKKRLVIVGNRWSMNDLNYMIHREEPGTAILTASCWGPRMEGKYKCRNLPEPLMELLREMPQGEPLWPERFSKEELGSLLLELKPRIYCTPADTPVLMSDLSTKRIDQIQQEDEVLGFEEKPSAAYAHRGFRRAKVTAVHSMKAPVVKITMASGVTVRSTADHPWFFYRGFRAMFGAPRVGDRLVHVFNPEMPSLTQEQRELGAWLGGIFDGEGHAGKYNIYIAQSPEKNPEVVAKIEDALSVLNIKTSTSDTTHTGCRTWYLLGGRKAYRHFLLSVTAAKSNRILEAMIYDKRIESSKRDPIVSIEPDGEELVYSLETTTKTYTAYGYLTHNSAQYLNDPNDPDAVDFRQEWLQYCDLDYDREQGIVVRVEKPDGDELVPLSCCNVYITWDPALDGKTAESENAIVVSAMDHRGRVFILDEYARKCDPLVALDDLLKIAHRWRKWLRASGLEEVLFQKVLGRLLVQRAQEQNIYLGLRTLKTPTGQSKDQRIRAWIGALFEARKVWVRRKCTHFVEQYGYFGVIGAKRDLIDAFAYATQLWSRAASPEEVLQDEEMEEQMKTELGLTGYGSALRRG